METQKSSELRARLRRIKSGTGKLRSGIPAVPGSSKMNTLTKESSESDDDFATVHFKLAAALEAAAAHASGLNYDWCNSKTFVSTGDTTIAAETEKPIAKQIKLKMQEFQPHPARKDHPENDKEAEKVTLVTATPSNSSYSSEDEGIAELHDGKTSDAFLTTVISANCDVIDDEQPLAVSEQAPTYFTAMNTMMVEEASASTSVTTKSDNQAAVTNILALPPFDPYAPQLKVQLMIKQIVSLVQLKQRIVDSSKGAISKNGPISECEIVAEMEFANIHVKHSLEEFFTFCSCKNCLEYREIVVHLMVDQFKAQHMVVMLVDALVKAYSPMLKNATAHNKFEKLLDANKEIYWMTCGYIYNKMAEHMYFIYDESLSDNMILVLFSAILLVNNPLLLLQILSFHVTCIVKAYAEGFLEIVDPDKNKIPAEEMLTYILDGYDDLCRISEHISCYLFAFENDFLRKFSLTWTLLCQRLYQQHVYLNLTDTMLACIITLKEDELKTHHAVLIKKYIRFDDTMLYVDKRWTDIWIELNKFNLSEVERKKRVCLLDVHRIFETVVQDAIELSLRESSDDNDFYDFQTLENRQLAWQNIMAYMKMKWPDGFFDPPNTLICEDKCKNCKLLLEYHADTCKCITCSIAGGPLPPKRNSDNTCYKCLALLLVEKEVTFYESKILNVCASDDFLSFIKNNEKRKSSTLEELGVEVCSALATDEKFIADDHQNPSGGIYHLAWAVFRHLNNRKRYKKSSVEEKYFCSKCELQACRLARKILNNEIALALSLHLIRYYQPLSMSREELRSILPNIMLYNRKMISSNIGLDLNDVHDLVVKIYWTFVISVYATYFIEFDNDCPLRLENFELVNNDIKLKTENLLGDKNDTKFVLFLDKIKSLSCEKDELESEMENSDDGHADEIQKKLEDFLKTNENVQSSQLFQKIPSKEFSTEYVPEAPTVASSSKKTSKDKSRKCCFDHSDLGDHCKENHSNKKRIKKECNHARMNETRDRLRKKLSQLISARKNMKTPADKQHTPHSTKINHPSKLKAPKVAASPSGANIKAHTKDDSLECLNTLCKRISNLSTGKASTTETAPSIATKTTHLNATTKSSTNKNNTNGLTKEPSHNKALNHNIQAHSGEKNISKNSIAAPSSGANKKNGNGLDMVNEIYELLGTYSKDHSKVKKWINETLSYIEGSSGGSGKQQPQPTNAKKAAKKAKQKQRREEEKRIAELQDLRGQFHDIYFKEFMDKYELKELKSSKKRDKKKISELETNVKNLQRAKAKVETAILELIATVKQTNTEFKFSYLPTKEQQLEKIQQLKATDVTASNNTSANMPQLINGGMQHSQPHQFMISSLQTNTHNLSATNIATSNYSLPYPQANNFPYHQIDVQNGVASMPFAMIRPPLSTPMCYAPPKHQQLSPDVVAAITANAACNSTNDPSKRIVTIRRINLPNVPEPQVTVTAKGSSPDKDKLLYTFVNGQLLQNGTTVPPITELPEVPLQTANLPAGASNCMSVPSLPLSKTQLKKERRRLAQKLIEEAEEAIKAERLLKEDLQLHKLREATAKRARKKTKNSTKDKLNIEPEEPEELSATKSKKKKKRMADSSASATSISTTDAGELLTSAYSAISTQRRSSSATSYSAAVPSSGVSTISPMNTRDNSVCSKKAKELEGKLQLKSNTQITQKQTKKGKKQSTKIPSTPPSTQPTIQEVEPSQTTEFDSVSNVKKRKLKRPKFIDNGQFDNNPFKSLHVQDFSSDSEILTSSCDEDENDVRTEYKYNETQPQEPVVLLKQNNLKLKAGKREQNKTDTSDVVLCKQENKKEQHCRLSNENTRLSLHTNDKNDKRCETTKAKQTIVENQKSPKANRNLLKGQSQEQKQSVSLAQPKYQQQPIRAKSATQQRPSSSQQPPSISKRNTVLTTRYDLSANQRTSTIVSSSNPLPASSMNTRHNSTRSTASASENQRKNSLEKSSNPLSKRALKQAQRNKHKSQKQQSNNDLYAGIPTNMGYFKANDFTSPSLQIKQQQKQFQQLKQCQQQQYKTIQQQMQNIQISNNHCPPLQQQKQRNHKYQSCNSFLLSSGDTKSSSEINSVNKNSTTSATANVSIMDQLNRGVQVENLSLPPGITLTKVDPVKSEQLRKKSESIKKLAKPLQQQQPLSQSFHHPGATIIAPPVAPVSGYYGLPYAGVAAAASLGQNGAGGGGSVIMLEAMPPNSSTSTKHQQIKLNTAASVAPAASSKTKTSKSKKRRNKSKLVNNPPQPGSNSAATAEPSTATTSNGQPKMVTLRNPMFHNGPPGATAAIIQQPTLMTGRTVGGLPIAAALPMDQPASIIKNENGMFTIRNPALQQAVANGLAIGGYRQFGNVNYYTPQEAMAEATRATQQSVGNTSGLSPTENATFSYFSNSSASDQLQQGGGGPVNVNETTCPDFSRNTQHSNANLICTRLIGGSDGLPGDSAVIARPVQPAKCISAIGSEIKNAQQQKQKSIEHKWTNFGQELSNNTSSDALARSSSFLSGSSRSVMTTSPIQDKYSHSTYYNGFVDVFPANSSQISACGRSSNTGSFFDSSDCHIKHNCGDDSPPPTISGFNHYLEGIPNTGVIRYDDATFLKTLMPGQNLNNEVSIHNVNDSNFSRNSTSPLAHSVEISAVYEHCPNSSTNYRDGLNEYGNDVNLFTPTSLLNESVNRDVESFKRFNYDFEHHKDKQKVHMNLNDLVIHKASSTSNRNSPFMDENALDKFVQNVNALQISVPIARKTDEQCSQLNIGAGTSGTCDSANGWW